MVKRADLKSTGSISIRWLARIIKLTFNPRAQPTYRDLMVSTYNRIKELTKGIAHLDDKHVFTLRKSNTQEEVSKMLLILQSAIF